MALTKDQKKAQVTQLRDRLKKTKSLIFVSYSGISVEDIGDYRGQLLDKSAEMKIGKKTLFKIAAKEEGYPEVGDDILDGPVGFVFSFEDEMSGAKASFEFGKKNDSVEILGGVLNGKVLNKEEAIELAKMLTKDELLAKFAAMIQSPLVSFASICGNPLSGFARCMKELAEKGGVGEGEKNEESTEKNEGESEAAEQPDSANSPSTSSHPSLSASEGTAGEPEEEDEKEKSSESPESSDSSESSEPEKS